VVVQYFFLQFLLDNQKIFFTAAEKFFSAATDGKDQINYPTDSICKKLYEQYQSMELGRFKKYFGELLFGGG